MGKPLVATLISFFYQLSTLLTSGVSVLEAIRLLETTESTLLMKRKLYFVRRDLVAGKKIIASLSYLTVYLEPMLQRWLLLGEETGQLQLMLQLMIDYLQGKMLLKRKMRQLLFYPTIVIIISSILTIGLLCFLVPQFIELAHETHAELPMSTRFIFRLSESLRHYGVMVFVALLCGIFIIRCINKMAFNRLSAIMRRIVPMMDQLHSQQLLIDFLSRLSLSLKAGLPLLDGFALMIKDQQEPFYLPITKLVAALYKGQSLANAMSGDKHFPKRVVQLVRIGEYSGQLQEMLDYLVQYYQKELNASLERLQAWLEPLIILILGVVIGGIVLGLYLPLFDMGNVWQ